MFSASVIISFYNNTAALKTIIRSLENQKDNFEVIIADDGSNEESTAIVASIISSSSIDIQHVWQKDLNFRKNRILNKAIHIARSDYLIFIDGDCIPQEHFIEDHMNNKEKNFILNGRRVDLPNIYKDQLLNSHQPQIFFSSNIASIFINYIFGKGKNIEKGLRFTNKTLSDWLNRKNKGIVGCNISLYKEDIISINGFNNNYEVASIGEDTDIEYRLVNSGKKVKNLFFQANMLHIQHPELPRLPEAVKIFEETISNKEFIAKNGYNEAYDKE